MGDKVSRMERETIGFAANRSKAFGENKLVVKAVGEEMWH